MVKFLEVSGGCAFGFKSPAGLVWPVDGVDLDLDRGGVLGLVGQSGSGKSLTALAIMGLLPRGAVIGGGRIVLAGHDLLRLEPARRRRLLGRVMFITFQGSASALNPTMTVGRQLAETLVLTRGLSWAKARTRAQELMEQVNSPPGADRVLRL